MPHQKPILVVVGRAIQVPKVPEPSEEMVAEYLERFAAEIERIFHKYKAEAGFPGLKLRVM